jgi:hypothetical protein
MLMHLCLFITQYSERDGVQCLQFTMRSSNSCLNACHVSCHQLTDFSSLCKTSVVLREPLCLSPSTWSILGSAPVAELMGPSYYQALLMEPLLRNNQVRGLSSCFSDHHRLVFEQQFKTIFALHSMDCVHRAISAFAQRHTSSPACLSTRRIWPPLTNPLLGLMVRNSSYNLPSAIHLMSSTQQECLCLDV